VSFESDLVRALNRRIRNPPASHSGFYLGGCCPLAGGEEMPFFLPSSPSAHTFLLGRTGSGKTTCLTRIQLGHLQQAHGFFNKDLHGAATEVLLGWAEAARARSLLCEPFSREKVLGADALNVPPELAYSTVQEILGFLRHRWAASWGPRLEEYLSNTLLPCVETKLTLVETPTFLSRPDFRRSVLRHVTDRQVQEFWNERFARLSPSQNLAAIEPALNKIAVFSRDPILRHIFGQQQGALNFDQILAEGCNLFGNFSSGHLAGSNFLTGGLLIPAFKNAVYRRPVGAAPYSVFLDEFQELVADEFLDDYLRSFRKFNCSVFLATQHLDLAPALKAAIFGNCTRFICFATNASDAAFLGREFGGHDGSLVAELLPELKTGQAIVKIRGESARLLRVDPVPPPNPEMIARGRANFLRAGKSPAAIEVEIEARYRRVMRPERPAPAPRTRATKVLTEGNREGYEDF
jgi:hypothetical protein